MRNLISRSRRHLASNKMSYWEHMGFASGHGCRCLKAAAFLIVHSVVPAWFPHAGSRLVARMKRDFTEHRRM